MKSTCTKRDIKHLPVNPANGVFLFFVLEAIIGVICYLIGDTVGYYWMGSIVLRVILQCAFYKEELYYPWWIAFTTIISYKLEAAADWHRMDSARAFAAVVAIEIIAIIVGLIYTHVVCSMYARSKISSKEELRP